MQERIPIGVIGAGHLGQHHARILHTLANVDLIGVADINPARKAVADAHCAAFFTDWRELLGKVRAVSLATPTTCHCEIARELLSEKISVLVEKPIATSSDEARRMTAAAEASGAVLAVGHVERHNPAVAKVRGILKTPKFFESHRMSVFTPRSLDIDVVMDLMIHDLDIILSLVRSEVESVHAVGIAILSPKVDIANARLEFTDGAVANVTASRVSSEKIRKLRFFQPNDYISVDYTEQRVGVWSLTAPASEGGRPQISAEYLPVDRAEPLQLEIEDFLRAVMTGDPPLVDGTQGLRALTLAERVMREIEKHGRKAGVTPPEWPEKND